MAPDKAKAVAFGGENSCRVNETLRFVMVKR